MWFEDPNMVILVVSCCIVLGVALGYFVKSIIDIITK